MEDTRIHFIGDELVAGSGDARALGWTGRVMARTRGLDATALTLAVPGETTAQLAERWHREVALRSTASGTNRLVIAVGAADVAAGVSAARSRLALANILDKAAADHRPCLVVGPPPLTHVPQGALSALSRAVGDVCRRRAIPYVETFEPLRLHDQWAADIKEHDGARPAQAGYGLLAWLVLHSGWYEWLGLPQPV